MTRLDEIKSRALAATDGPWEEYDSNEGTGHRPMWEVANDAFHNPPTNEDAPWVAVEIHTGGKADAEFIAHARTDVPALVAAVEAVLALHSREADGYGGWTCATCLDDERGFDPEREPWPCPTVTAIRDALGEDA